MKKSFKKHISESEDKIIKEITRCITKAVNLGVFVGINKEQLKIAIDLAHDTLIYRTAIIKNNE